MNKDMKTSITETAGKVIRVIYLSLGLRLKAKCKH